MLNYEDCEYDNLLWFNLLFLEVDEAVDLFRLTRIEIKAQHKHKFIIDSK